MIICRYPFPGRSCRRQEWFKPDSNPKGIDHSGEYADRPLFPRPDRTVTYGQICDGSTPETLRPGPVEWGGKLPALRIGTSMPKTLTVSMLIDSNPPWSLYCYTQTQSLQLSPSKAWVDQDIGTKTTRKSNR